MGEPEKSMAWVGAVGMYDWSVAARKMLLIDFLVTNILGAGTERHQGFIQDLVQGTQCAPGFSNPHQKSMGFFTLIL